MRALSTIRIRILMLNDWIEPIEACDSPRRSCHRPVPVSHRSVTASWAACAMLAGVASAEVANPLTHAQVAALLGFGEVW